MINFFLEYSGAVVVRRTRAPIDLTFPRRKRDLTLMEQYLPIPTAAGQELEVAR